MAMAAAKATGSGTPCVTSQAAVMPGGGHGRADGEIEAAGDDDDGFADRDDADDRDAAADVEEIGRGEEVGRDEGQNDPEKDEDGEEAEGIVPAVPDAYRRRPSRRATLRSADARSAGGLTRSLRARSPVISACIAAIVCSGGWACGASSPAIRPWRTTTMRSQTWRMSVKRWLIIRIETPRALNCPIRPMRTRIFSLESAAVGSSRSSRRGWNWRARATATSWRWPPDKRADDAVRLEVGAELAHDLARRLLHRRPVEELERAEAPPPLAAEKDIGGNIEIAAEREVLVDHLDAGGAGIERAAEATSRPSKRMVPVGRRVEAGQDFHQRRLAGAVVADQPDSLGRADREIDAVEGDNGSESLGDFRQLEQRLGHRNASPELGIDRGDRVLVEEDCARYGPRSEPACLRARRGRST